MEETWWAMRVGWSLVREERACTADREVSLPSSEASKRGRTCDGVCDGGCGYRWMNW